MYAFLTYENGETRVGLNLAWNGMESLYVSSGSKIVCERRCNGKRAFYEQQRTNTCMCVRSCEFVCVYLKITIIVFDVRWNRTGELMYTLTLCAPTTFAAKQSYELNQKVCHDQINGK